MIKSIYLSLSMIFLFAFTQIGMPALITSHMMDCHEAQHQDQGNTEHHCEQCLSLSHAADANVAQDFNLGVMDDGYMLVSALPTSIVLTHFFSCSVRAPPKYLIV